MQNTSNAIRKLVRREYLKSPDRIINQLNASRKGKRTMVTIENPNKEETNRPFIRIEGKAWFKSQKKTNQITVKEAE